MKCPARARLIHVTHERSHWPYALRLPRERVHSIGSPKGKEAFINPDPLWDRLYASRVAFRIVWRNRADVAVRFQTFEDMMLAKLAADGLRETA